MGDEEELGKVVVGGGSVYVVWWVWWLWWLWWFQTPGWDGCWRGWEMGTGERWEGERLGR